MTGVGRWSIITLVRRGLPTGTVTFLFTDVEGSTKLLHELGAERYATALQEQRRLLRHAFTSHGGVEVDTQGDAFFVAFPTAPGALAAAAGAQEALAAGPVRVRMGLHTGTPHLAEEGYIGAEVHKGARIAAAGHGGQVLLSKETRELVQGDVVDLGEHRVKDFAEPVWIFQLGAKRFPPLKTISNTNLPHPASSFVGREKEVVEVVALLRDGARLLTLTGPGGTGKTRLALEAAAELVPHFKAGVFWVGLAPIRDSALVTETIAHSIGARDGLADHIGERELLLLLDNLEQVVAVAPELAALVEACPNLHLLATSREVLRVRGEVEYPVLPLADPEAVELFCARARAEPDETVHELCRALDNLPLALELAAARASVLSPKQILERLSQRLDLLKGGTDADPRQQTLRATIEWGYELLSPDDQRLFARLSVFRGGSTLEAADEVTEADLDTLQSLVDKSLLRHTDERFAMLETIREYAAERLEASGEAEALRRRHVEHFLALAEEAEPHLFGPNPREWLNRLEAEHDNLRAAIDRLKVADDTQRDLRLVGAIWKFWDLRGHLAEAQRRLEGALAADSTPTVARAKALAGAARVGRFGSAEAAALRAREALAIYHELGDAWGAAYSQFVLAESAFDDDPERARGIYEDSVRAFREVGNEHYALLATHNLAYICAELGDDDRARTLHDQNLRQARVTDDKSVEALALRSLAGYMRAEGRVREGLSMLASSTLIFRDLGDRVWTANNLGSLAHYLAVQRNARSAAAILSTAEALRKEIGGGEPLWVAEMNDETLTTIRAQLDEAAFAEAWEQGRALTVDEAVALALDSLD